MELTILEATPDLVRAGYVCPCGCRPSVEYARGTDLVEDACCCGNQFGVGQRATASVSPRAGFRSESRVFESPWGERVEAAWLVGPSLHGPSAEHSDHEHEHASGGQGTAREAIDPVCGMTVVPETALSEGFHSSYQGRDYYFCGKGCKLEFDEDPEHYLDPSYVPSM